MRALLLAGVLSIGVGAAHAQPTADAKDDTTGLFCVYNRLAAGERAGMVADVFLYDTAPEDDVGNAALVVNDAARACAEEFMLSPSKAASASDMGIYGVAVDHLADIVREQGANKRAIDKMFSVYDALTDEELAKLSEGEWRSDIAFSGKVKRSLVAAGVPDKDAAIDAAFDIFEVSAMADQVIYLFLVDDL
jgi:hypothetical protein